MTQIKDDEDYISPGQSLLEAGMYAFMGPVDTESVKPVVEWILHANYVVKKKKKELLLMICSEGGEVESAFALIDVMQSSNIPIKTVGLPISLGQKNKFELDFSTSVFFEFIL